MSEVMTLRPFVENFPDDYFPTKDAKRNENEFVPIFREGECKLSSRIS